MKPHPFVWKSGERREKNDERREESGPQLQRCQRVWVIKLNGDQSHRASVELIESEFCRVVKYLDRNSTLVKAPPSSYLSSASAKNNES